MSCPGCHPQTYLGIRSPGTLLASVIYEVTKTSAVNCAACSERARQMNEWGWIGCWQNRDIIIQWMVEEARNLGHKVDDNSVRDLLFAAIKDRLS